MVLGDIDDGILALIESVLGSPSKSVNLGTPSKDEFKDDFEKYFREVDGLGSLAKQAGILDTNGDLVTKSLSSAGETSATSSGAQTYLYVTSSPTKHILPKSAGTPVSVNDLISKHLANSSTSAAAQRLTMFSTTPSSSSSFLSDMNRKRPAPSPTLFSIESVDTSDSKRPRKGEKGSKGLRHFSMKVCEKVQRKGVTTYNEVADELVSEFTDPKYMLTEQAQYDQKNIRRRVYDALNVLMAMNIISKEKKEIRWIGLPTNSAQECQNLEVEKMRRLERIEHKTQQLNELLLQQIAYKNLVQRNKEMERHRGLPAENSSIQLPFVIVNTDKKTVIDCSISNDKYEYLFNFDNTFEIHDDIEVLKRMGLAFGLEKGECSQDNLHRAIELLPKSLEPYVKQIAESGGSQTRVSSNGSLSAGPSARQSLTTGSDSLIDETNKAASAISSNTSYLAVNSRV